MSWRVGIDPGITGAIALINGEDAHRVWDMPAVADGKGRTVSGAILAEVFGEIMDITGDDAHPPRVILEQVSSMPRQGVRSMFSFGRSLGVVEGVIGAMQMPHIRVKPAIWKRKANLLRKPKEHSLAEAIRIFPEMNKSLRRKKDIGRAEALLIAFYGDLDK